MKLSETLTYSSLEGLSLLGMTLCGPSVTSGFGGSAGSGEVTGGIFFQDALVTAGFLGVRLESEGLQPKPTTSQGFSWVHCSLLPG